MVAAVGPDELPDAPARLVGEVDRWDLVVAGLTVPMTPIGLDRADIEAVVAVLHDADQPLIWMDDVAVGTSRRSSQRSPASATSI